MSNPYITLGIPETATKDEAKLAFRKLAFEHHPDHGGSPEKFREIKSALDAIEAGYTTKPAAPKYESSFTQPNKRRPWGFKNAGKPAPGFEAKGPPPMPRTTRFVTTGGFKHEVTLEITAKQAFEGCIIPFMHGNEVLEYEVRPGSEDRVSNELIMPNAMVGAQVRPHEIKVRLKIVLPKTHEFQAESSLYERKTGNMTVTMKVCALGLFTGGKLFTKDFLGENVEVHIPAGFDFAKPIVIQGKGYGPVNRRGDLFVTIEPVFKTPSELNANELRQLQRLNEMASVK